MLKKKTRKDVSYTELLGQFEELGFAYRLVSNFEVLVKRDTLTLEQMNILTEDVYEAILALKRIVNA